MDTKVKAIFFAQYFNQDVYHYDGWEDNSTEILNADKLSFSAQERSGCCLLLRSVDQLTDEEKKVINGFSAYRVTDKNKKKIAESMLRHLFELNSWSGNTIIQMFSYLRSIGVLLPFTCLSDGKPVTLSPDEIVVNGWAKIRETGNLLID